MSTLSLLDCRSSHGTLYKCPLHFNVSLGMLTLSSIRDLLDIGRIILHALDAQIACVHTSIVF